VEDILDLVDERREVLHESVEILALDPLIVAVLVVFPVGDDLLDPIDVVLGHDALRDEVCPQF